MAREGTLTQPIDLERHPPPMISRWFRDVNKAIDLGMFTPHVGMSCGWCGMKDNCYVHTDGAPMPDFVSDIHSTLESE
jgi:hypothetical protein